MIDEHGVFSDSTNYTKTAGENRSLELNEFMILESKQWFVSTSYAGATPCSENSVSGPIADNVEIVLRNRVFSPQLGEQLHYSLNLPPAATVSIEIFDLAGRRHFTIAEMNPMSSGDYSYGGGSDYYGTLPVGAYIMKVTTEGDINFSKKIGFAVASSR